MDRDTVMQFIRAWKNFRKENGSSIIEMALILPVFLLLTFGFIAFCLLTFGVANMNYASRSALRYATLHSSTSFQPTAQGDLDRIVNSFLFAYPPSNHTVSATYTNGNNVGSGVTINLNITYQFNVMSFRSNGMTFNMTAYGSVIQ